MKKKHQDNGPRKLQLHKETLHNLLHLSGGFSLTCITCPDHTGTQNCGICV
jgi:hypothetical protein